MDPEVPSLQVIRRPFIIQENADFTCAKMSASKLTELVNDAEMRLTNDGKDFILGYGYYEDRIVVLGTIEFLRKLCSTDTVFMSSYNIKLESKLFRHLYTLHCFVDERLVPMVFIIYSNIILHFNYVI
ncbi:unnamed protein product [Macrosiphum euphorbiae]|uniref:Uncharacterized protein n=1 Tax=Macrosiphum euphorbiae TaxID=13131 RepID=A0AAV0WPG2_9HEMI|nr:unnamed protein product [Macrosiphum euphorbiae]